MNSSIILNKRQILERLRGFVSAKQKVKFLEWQKTNLEQSDWCMVDRTKYNNRIKWLNIQININTKLVYEYDPLEELLS
jgi:hypothetical protein